MIKIKKITNKSIIISVILIVILIIGLSYSKYTLGTDGQLKFSVAKPISRAIINKDLYISNYFQKPLEFYICNYDENNNISDVGMEYYITLELSQENAPLMYKLYRVYSEEVEEEVEIIIDKNTIRTIKPVEMNGNENIKHNYKLEISYDNNSINSLDENLGVSISVKSQQINPNN